MKKILTVSLLAALTLTGCAAQQETNETAQPVPSQSETTSPKPTETGSESEGSATLPAEYVSGFGDSDYNPEDTAKVLGLLETSCAAAMAEGVTETYGDSKIIMFSDVDAYNGYSAFYSDKGTAELVYSVDFFFTCFLDMEYQMFKESGETDLAKFPVRAVEVADGVFQVKYDANTESLPTQYFFNGGKLVRVIADPATMPAYDFSIKYGKPSDAEAAELKKLVDALS